MTVNVGNYSISYERYPSEEAQVADMLGATMADVVVNRAADVVLFVATDGRAWVLIHEDDCCERVQIEDMVGDPSDLVGAPLLRAEESTNQDNPPAGADSYTWTFYRFATVKGDVDLRWLGTSNGYYSESVQVREVTVAQLFPDPLGKEATP